jgi:hypothetical protein
MAPIGTTGSAGVDCTLTGLHGSPDLAYTAISFGVISVVLDVRSKDEYLATGP